MRIHRPAPTSSTRRARVPCLGRASAAALAVTVGIAGEGVSRLPAVAEHDLLFDFPHLGTWVLVWCPHRQG